MARLANTTGGRKSTRLTLDVKSNAGIIFGQMRKAFPGWVGRLMRGIGLKSAYQLWNTEYQGQSIKMRNYRRKGPTEYVAKKDSRKLMGVKLVGRKMEKVRVTSFPANLFERGRTLRNGKKEPGKYIITRKLASTVKSNLAQWANHYENKIIQHEINEIEAKSK